MAVVKTVSTNAKYVIYSSTNATLATAFEEVIDAIDADQVNLTAGQASLIHDGTSYVYCVILVI